MPVTRTSPRTLLKNPGSKQRIGRISESVLTSTTSNTSLSVFVPSETPRRTPNQFFCYRAWVLREGLLNHITTSQTELSKMIADQWAKMTPEEKQPFVEEARALKAAQQTEFQRGSKMVPVRKGGRAPCGAKSMSISNSNSGINNELQANVLPAYYSRLEPQFAADIRPASHDRIEPQFVCAEAANPIFPPARLAASSISGTYYPSLDTSPCVVAGVNTHEKDRTCPGVDPRPMIDNSDNLGEASGKQCKAEEDKLMEQYLNLDEFGD